MILTAVFGMHATYELDMRSGSTTCVFQDSLESCIFYNPRKENNKPYYPEKCEVEVYEC